LRKRDRFVRALSTDFARSGALVFVASMLANVCNYIFHFTVTRRLGPQSYGVVASTLSIMAIAALPSVVLSTVVVRYAAELAAVGDSAKVRALVERVLLLTCVIALSLAGLFLGNRFAVARYFHIEDAVVIGLVGLALGAGIISGVLRAVLQGAQDFRSYAVCVIFEGVGKALLGVLLVFFGFGVRGAVAGCAIAMLLGLLYALRSVWVNVGNAPRVPLHLDFSRLLRVFGWVSLSTMAITVLSNMDIALVKHFFDPTQAGFYSALSLAGKVLLFVLGILPMVLIPKAASHAARGESALPIFAQTFGVAVLIAAIGVGVLGLIPGVVIAVMSGGAYAAAAPYLFEYGAAMAFLGLTIIVSSFKIAVHQFDYVVGLLIVAAGEIAAVSLHHDSLRAVVHVLLVGNALGCLQSLRGIASWRECRELLRGMA
jgi:O-antigen/teichoic acid export membrane protein